MFFLRFFVSFFFFFEGTSLVQMFQRSKGINNLLLEDSEASDYSFKWSTDVIFSLSVL